MKQFKRILLITALSLGCVKTATANFEIVETPLGDTRPISCVFKAQELKGGKYGIGFQINWGGYSRYLTGVRNGPGEIIYRFSNFDGAGYKMYITTNRGTIKNCTYMNHFILNRWYSSAKVYTCGLDRRC